MGKTVFEIYSSFKAGITAKGYTVSNQAIPYAANFNFGSSVRDGVRKLKAELNEACKSNIVLVGYSQGAMVIRYALQTSGHQLTGSKLSSSVLKRIKGIALMGDPGASGPKLDTRFHLIKRNYCVNKDPVCTGTLNTVKSCIKKEVENCPHFWYENGNAAKYGARSFNG